MEGETRDGRTEIHLSAVLDLSAATRLRDTLLEVLSADSGGDVVVGAADVERVSTAAVQVLLVAAADFRAATRHFVIANPSERMVGAFRQLGLAAVLAQSL